MAYSVADILKNPKFPPEWPFSPMDFKRQDEMTDNMFYYQPRLVYHIDDAAVNALTKFYAQSIPEKADLLDMYVPVPCPSS